MKLRYQLMIAAFVVSLAGGLVWAALHYHGKYLDEQQRADTAEHSLSLANATITDMQVRQRDVAALDAKYTQELADANAQNAALQRRLDNGGRVLVKGKCPVPASNQSTSSGSVGNDASIELSDVAGRNVLSIRSGIISDQAKVKYLQDYIRQQCLK
ncbi:lysis protein [Enterobacteriaceae bacterium H20N1]|uniref:Lysis protein n=1 Tax=Dryocola boscaweniae TaxID=2925397 RepID=A0A9X3APM1_9ENTR|nr:lysis protein [Dryocola boscaweniae]MCT4701210.1 lysis protein [Dryocola boscaweniae]MCT4718285.1 lysis protein [Dryocola boscaweniae]